MDFSGTQGKLPIPMHAPASPFASGGGGHVLHQLRHEHGNSSNNNGNESPAKLPPSPAAATMEEGSSSGKKRAAGGLGGGGSLLLKYRECLKNHAAAIGGNATDGCGEFMPSGEEGSLGALRCSACGCHRNFHRKVLDDDDADADGCFGGGYGRRLVAPAMPHHNKSHHYAATMRSVPLHHQPLMNAVPLCAAMHGASESDEMDGARGSAAVWSAKKRFRTKFTAEQKARMLEFAKRVGWRLQNLDDAMVHAFCQEIGVKRRVLKVWMHNNKHSLAIKRIEAAPEAASPPAPPPQMPLQMVPPPPPPPSSSLPGPSFLLGGPSSPPPPPPPFHRGPASPAPFKME
jgi:ZF-HD class homeobox domain-containing protein